MILKKLSICFVICLLLLTFCSCTNNNQSDATAYEKAVSMGYEGTSEEFLAALAAENIDGEESAYNIACEKGFDGTYEEWLSLLNIDIQNEKE